MNIVWINKREWKSTGPIVNVGVHNAHSFASIGLESDLFLAAGQSPASAQDLKDFYSLDHLPSLHIHPIPRARAFGLNESAPIYRQARRHILNLAKKGRVAVFTREPGFLIHLAMLTRHPNIRTFYELHDLYADISWRPQSKVRLETYRMKWLERLLLPRISGLVCITSDQEKMYQKIFPQARTIYAPLGTKTFPVSDPEKKRLARTVFYVGHMHGSKGVSFLREASLALAHANIRTEFWGGGARDAQPILEAAQAAGVQDYITAVPFQPPARMHEALAERASLGVVMLTDTFYNRHLTCPVKALDYLSHGIPALGTDIPSVRDVLSNAGNYVENGNVEAFVSKAKALLDDPEAYAQAVAAARARCAEITWEERARALTDFAQKAFEAV